MTFPIKKQVSTSQRQKGVYTTEDMPKTFVRKYVLFQHHAKPKPGVTLSMLGWINADSAREAKQQFAAQRMLAENTLYVQRFTEATRLEQQQAEELQAEWEAQQHEDQTTLSFDADAVYLQKLDTELRETENAIKRLEAKVVGDVSDLDEQADKAIAKAFALREPVFPNYHPSDAIPHASAQRSKIIPILHPNQTEIGESEHKYEKLRDLYDKTVKRLREDGYLE